MRESRGWIMKNLVKQGFYPGDNEEPFDYLKEKVTVSYLYFVRVMS